MTTPELLSPAGTPECAMAAFDGGADAVYCGLGRFNARERAENFTPDALGRIIGYAHRNGKKVYLTVNTLLHEAELPGMMELLDAVSELDPDALIVQDPGTLELAKTYYPHLRLHASTQMGFHNSAGLRTAERLGFRRVILERQVTLDELRRMMRTSPLEVEVFLYGSLCCSLSGRCLLSAFSDHESGNRGRCKQPCRRRWNGEFRLSPADLDGTSVLPELRKLGVASLKIEGRLRPPEYVWKTARAFRLLLDGPVEPEPERALEAAKLLASAAGRRSSTGFFFSAKWDKLIDPGQIGAFGIPAAEVGRVRGTEIAVRALNRLHLGDRLRVVPPGGGDGESFSLTRLSVDGRPQTVVRANTRCVLTAPVPVRPGDTLYKIGENGFDFSRCLRALPPPSHPVRLAVAASAGAWEITADAGGSPVVWRCGTAFAPPRKHALDADAVRAMFAGGAPENWHVAEVNVRIDGAFFVPAAELKRLRREFWGFAAEKLGSAPTGRALLDFYHDHQKPRQEILPLASEAPEYRIPGFCAEGDLDGEAARVREAYAGGIRRFRACAWYAFDLLKDLAGIEIVTAFPIPAGNSAGCALLKKLGAAAAEADPELAGDDLAELRAHAPIPVLDPAEVPVLATRLKLPPGEWTGTRGDRLRVRYDKREKLSLVFAER